MNDLNTDDLRAAFEKGIPAFNPSAVDRPTRVLHAVKQNRRRRMAGAVLGAMFVVAAGATAMAHLNSGHVVQAAAASSSCPPAPALTDLTSAGPDHVAAGAVSVSLCALSSNGDPDFYAPLDGLTTNLPALTDTINSAPIAHDKTCEGYSIGRAYALVFTFDDGHTEVVTGREANRCDLLATGPVTREGGSAVWQTYLSSLITQRKSTQPIGTGQERPECNDLESDSGIATTPVGTISDAQIGVLCVNKTSDSGSFDGPTRSIPLSESDLKTLVNALVGKTTGAFICPASSEYYISAVDSWGDHVLSLFGSNCEPAVQGDDATQIVDRALSSP